MSLIERLFPASELAAMKHAVLTASEEPAAKRRKVQRQDSTRSRHSTDSGYNSEDERSSITNHSFSHASQFRKQSVFSNTDTMAALNTQKSNQATSAQNSPSTPTEDTEDAIHSDFTSQIARARARLYSNASMSVPSPPNSTYSAGSPATSSSTSQQHEYHSPVTGQHTAVQNSGFNLSSFTCLGLAVSSYEQSLLDTLLPCPEAYPKFAPPATPSSSIRAVKPQYSNANPVQQRTVERSSYQGFAISMHDDEDEEDSEVAAKIVPSPPSKKRANPQAHIATLENMHDFFNIEAASEGEGEPEGEAVPAADPSSLPSKTESSRPKHTSELQNMHDFFNIEAASEDEIRASA